MVNVKKIRANLEVGWDLRYNFFWTNSNKSHTALKRKISN